MGGDALLGGAGAVAGAAESAEVGGGVVVGVADVVDVGGWCGVAEDAGGVAAEDARAELFPVGWEFAGALASTGGPRHAGTLPRGKECHGT